MDRLRSWRVRVDAGHADDKPSVHELTDLGAPFSSEPTSLDHAGPDVAVYATEAGDVQAFVTDFGFCPTVRPANGPRIERVVALDDVLLVIGPRPGPLETPLVVQALALY